MNPHLLEKVDGHRGGFLLLISVPWVFFGLSHVLTNSPTRAGSFQILPAWLNQNELGWAWIACGVFALAAAFLGKRHPKWTTVGFTATAIPPALWVAIYFLAFATGVYPPAILGVITYGAITALMVFCSGWPNPAKGD